MLIGSDQVDVTAFKNILKPLVFAWYCICFPSQIVWWSVMLGESHPQRPIVGRQAGATLSGDAALIGTLDLTTDMPSWPDWSVVV